MDITRREDAFDLSGPFLPPQEPMPQRPVSSKYWKYPAQKSIPTSLLGEGLINLRA